MSRTIGASDLAGLQDGAVFLTKGGVLFRKWKNWYELGVDGYIRNQWVYPNDSQGNMPYREHSFTGWHEQDWFPATLIHEGDES